MPVMYPWTEEASATAPGGFRALPQPILAGEQPWQALERLRAHDQELLESADTLVAERAAGRLSYYTENVGRGLRIPSAAKKLLGRSRRGVRRTGYIRLPRLPTGCPSRSDLCIFGVSSRAHSHSLSPSQVRLEPSIMTTVPSCP